MTFINVIIPIIVMLLGTGIVATLDLYGKIKHPAIFFALGNVTMAAAVLVHEILKKYLL